MAGASEANRRGVAHLLAGDLDAAAACFLSALDVASDDPSAWHNLSLVHKRRRAWADVARCAERAGELARSRNEGAWWNAGIAATALHDWARARDAWRRFGFDLEPGDAPVSLPMGPVALLAGEGPPVFGTRLDPVRARVTDVPHPRTGFAFDDVVLCDAEPLGEVPGADGGKPVRLVAVLERWRASGIPTVTARVTCRARTDRDALLASAHRDGLGATDWTDGVRRADGPPDEPVWSADRVVGLAGPPASVHAVLDRWRAAGPATRVVHDADVSETLAAPR